MARYPHESLPARARGVNEFGVAGGRCESAGKKVLVCEKDIMRGRGKMRSAVAGERGWVPAVSAPGEHYLTRRNALNEWLPRSRRGRDE